MKPINTIKKLIGSHSEYKQRADILEGKAEENLQTALPYMETALMLEPKNPDVLRSLRVYYDRLGMNAKKR